MTSQIQKGDEQSSRCIDGFKKPFSKIFFSPFNRSAVPSKTPQSRVNNPLSSIRNKVSKSGCKTDMLKASQFIYPAFKPRALSEREK